MAPFPHGGAAVSGGRTLLVKGAHTLVTLGDRPTLTDGYVTIRDGFIEAVGTGPPPATSVQVVIDATDMLVLPGLINTHHHLFQTLTRAVPDALDVGLFDWLKTLYPRWAGLDDEAIYLSTQVGMAELLLSGCTTTTDHHYVFPQRALQGIDVQIEAAAEIGMRFHPTRGSMSLGIRNGGLPPDELVQDEDEILNDCERLIRRYHNPQPGAMVRIALAPCSPFSVTRTLMEHSAALAARHGVRLHTHLAETLDEEVYCLQVYGMRPSQLLEEVGWLHEGVWLAHGIHFNDAEIARLGAASVAIAHCPSSNARLGSGLFPLRKLRNAGVRVGLGVDGSASNDASNLLLELRQALFLQRVVHGPQALGVAQVVGLATAGGAACLGREDLGALAPGMAADLALFDLNALAYAGAHDPLGALVLCAPTRAHTVVVGGRVVVRDGQLRTVDEAALVRRHRAKARALLARAH